MTSEENFEFWEWLRNRARSEKKKKQEDNLQEYVYIEQEDAIELNQVDIEDSETHEGDYCINNDVNIDDKDHVIFEL